MIKKIFINIWNFYYEGFRSMTLGRTLWALILGQTLHHVFHLKTFFLPLFSERQKYGREAGICGK